MSAIPASLRSMLTPRCPAVDLAQPVETLCKTQFKGSLLAVMNRIRYLLRVEVLQLGLQTIPRSSAVAMSPQIDTTVAELNLAQSISLVCSFSKWVVCFVPVPSVESLCWGTSWHSAGTRRGCFAERASRFASASCRRDSASAAFSPSILHYSV